jgi:hypothetical protein
MGIVHNNPVYLWRIEGTHSACRSTRSLNNQSATLAEDISASALVCPQKTKGVQSLVSGRYHIDNAPKVVLWIYDCQAKERKKEKKKEWSLGGSIPRLQLFRLMFYH